MMPLGQRVTAESSKGTRASPAEYHALLTEAIRLVRLMDDNEPYPPEDVHYMCVAQQLTALRDRLAR